MARGNAVIGQSGGPTSVINASLSGVVQGCLRMPEIDRIFGMRYGIEGFMQNLLLDLGNQPQTLLEALKHTPGSALGSCRHKLGESDFEPILSMLKKHNIRYFFLIGGNDTMDTIHRVEAYCKANGYDLTGIGIPKTVDNDLFGTDHTPGYGSAARYVALSVKQGGILARDMQRVDQYVIFQTVGREAGWLPAASALAREKLGDAPHIILMPEKRFNQGQFLAEVKRCRDRFGWVSIVCGEGICCEDGTPVSASRAADKFNNIEFGAMGGTSAALMLHRMIREEFGWRGEFQVTESLQMCAADRVNALDAQEAFLCGHEAARLAAEGRTGVMVSLEREANEPYRCGLATAPLSEVAVRAKPLPDGFIAANGYDVTPQYLKYAAPLVGELPSYFSLEDCLP